MSAVPNAQSGLRERVLAEHFPGSPERLVIGGVPASELAARFGTPLYVYDAEILRAQARRVRRALPGIDVIYSIKANPSVAVAQVLREEGLGAEAASAGELHVARAAGFTAIHLAGPGKSALDLDTARSLGVDHLNLESESEYEALAARGERWRLLLRVNPRAGLERARLRMSGGAAKFGVDEDEVPALAARVAKEGRAELLGLQIYAGTQCFDAAGWLAVAKGLVELADRIDAPLPTLGLGGGFGYPCFEGDPSLDLEALGRGVEALRAPGRRHFVELGRYLTAPAGVYLTRALHVKRSQGQGYAILDGGLHHHAAAAGVGSVVRRAFPIVAAERLLDPGAPTRIGGPLCTPADELASGAPLPPLARGDLLAILLSGAYGLSFSSVLFLGHPLPAEVLVDRGEPRLIRERGRPEDVLAGQRFER